MAACLALAALLPVRPGSAAPPSVRDDDEVLLKLAAPRAIAEPRIRQLQARLVAQPLDLAAADELSRIYLGLAARSDEARYYGYAKTVLLPWWDRERLPPQLLRSRARIRRYYHAFAEAEVDTRRLLELEPGDAGAWFDLALLELGKGDAGEAARACVMVGQSLPSMGQLCRGYVDSAGPDIRRGYATLVRVLERLPPGERGHRLWALTALADAAARLGLVDAAQRHYRAARQLDAGAPDVLAGYSDFLLDRRRPREVLAVLAEAPDTVAVLLRRSLAHQAIGDGRGTATRTELERRLERRRLLGDAPYYDEEIRAQLHLFGRPSEALRLAGDYWRLHKSPRSARLLVEAAAASGDPGAAADVQRWLRANPGVYPALLAPAGARTAGVDDANA